jgi:hypothetical protein
MKIPALRFLFVILSLLSCVPAFAQSLDCEDAMAACRQKCGDVKAFDYSTKKFLPDTNLKGQCEEACVLADEICEQQDGLNGCDTFYYRCAAYCPWKILNTNTNEPIETTDAFYQCGSSCSAGHEACLAANTRTPQERERRGQFYTCTEAKYACLTTCMASVPTDSIGIKIQSGLSDICAHACNEGIAMCNQGGKEFCNDYFGNCASVCPEVEYDEAKKDFHSTGDDGKLCLKSCRAGGDYCINLSK